MTAILRTNPHVCEVEDFLKSLVGAKISGGEETKEGMRLYLDDGRVFIFSGYFVIYTGRLEPMH